MDRRTALRTLATAGALPLLAPERVAAVLEARRYLASDEDATGSGQALSEHELVMVGLIADVILPRTETPSASDLGVHEFVDLIAAEWMDGDESNALHDGLATLDETSRARFGRGFVDSSGREQLMLISELDTSMPVSVSSDDSVARTWLGMSAYLGAREQHCPRVACLIGGEDEGCWSRI